MSLVDSELDFLRLQRTFASEVERRNIKPSCLAVLLAQRLSKRLQDFSSTLEQLWVGNYIVGTEHGALEPGKVF